MPRIQFNPSKSEAQDAIVVSFDLSGFSDFCNRPDAYLILPKFLSQLFDELNSFLLDGLEAGLENLGRALGSSGERRKVVNPEFLKFTGDGAIMIWLTGWDGKFSSGFCTALVMAMRNLQTRIAAAVPEWEKEWRVTGLPKRARFGIAAGQVYGLSDKTTVFKTADDYVGYSINLAVRLQDHCKEVGFLIHETLHPNIPGLTKLSALGMKGSQVEPVLAFETDLTSVSAGVFKTKFRRT